MTYDPFRDTFIQALALSQLENDPNDPNNPNAPIDPFNRDDTLRTIQTSYSGGFQVPPTEFKAVGYTPTLKREGQITPANQESALEIVFEDDPDIRKQDSVEYTTIDAYCTLRNTKDEVVYLDGDTFSVVGNNLTFDADSKMMIDGTLFSVKGNTFTINTLVKDGIDLNLNDAPFVITDQTVVVDGNTILIDSSELNIISESNRTFAVIDCAAGVTTIPPVKDQCDGGVDTDGEPQTDENNHRQARTFDLNTAHTDLKRLRVETDYPANEIRIYVSTFHERILDADEFQDPAITTAFDDPSRCEKQAILDELALITPGVGVSLTLVPDPAYDFVFKEDAEGNFILDEDKLPVPAYTFSGTAVPTRQ